MATFVPGQMIRSREPTIEVDVLDAGNWRFELVVVDDQKRISAPAVLRVEVQASTDFGIGVPRR